MVMGIINGRIENPELCQELEREARPHRSSAKRTGLIQRPGPAESGPLAALPCVVLFIQVSLSQVPVTFPRSRSHRRPPDPQVSYPPVPAHLLVGNGGTPREG